MITTMEMLELAGQSAGQDGNANLTFDIHSLIEKHQASGNPDDDIEHNTVKPELPPFDPPYMVERAEYGKEYILPGGKYRGRHLRELDDTTLASVWSGYNGCGHWQVAAILRDELDRRIKNR